jgi:hypothetical protein
MLAEGVDRLIAAGINMSVYNLPPVCRRHRLRRDPFALDATLINFRPAQLGQSRSFPYLCQGVVLMGG